MRAESKRLAKKKKFVVYLCDKYGPLSVATPLLFIENGIYLIFRLKSCAFSGITACLYATKIRGKDREKIRVKLQQKQVSKSRTHVPRLPNRNLGQ